MTKQKHLSVDFCCCADAMCQNPLPVQQFCLPEALGPSLPAGAWHTLEMMSSDILAVAYHGLVCGGPVSHPEDATEEPHQPR